jgi:hypothetical protein
MGKNMEMNLNGRISKPDEWENGSACYDFSATRVSQLPVGPILVQCSPILHWIRT